MAAILSSTPGGNRSRLGSAHITATAWNYADPPSDENSMLSEPQFHENNESSQRPNGSQWQPTKPSGPGQNHTNTHDTQLSSNSNHAQDSSYLGLSKPSILTRKRSELSAAGSDADSLLDLYKPKTEKRGPSRNVHAKEQVEDGDDSSKWIHRDKLAEIESKELQEAGLRPGRTSRSRTRSSSRSVSRSDAQKERDRSQSGARTGGEERADSDLIREGQTQRLSTQQEASEERLIQETQSHAEALHERDRHNRQVSSQSARIATSRIPISKVGHAPVPTAVIERDSPLPRSRAGSGAWSGSYEDGTMFNKVRGRNQSMGNPVLQTSGDEGGIHTPPRTSIAQEDSSDTAASPAANASKPCLTSGARKVTPGGRAVSGQQKPRLSSNSHRESPGRRPGTVASRQGTSTNRPEGEAPWIAHMFKPDPRLPPEEQLLPTHAKRLKQEQWEKEGHIGSAYDRNFNLLNDDGLTHQPVQDEVAQAPHEKEVESEWPLPASRTESVGARSGTSGTEHGGYKTIPSVPPVQVPSPSVVQRSLTESAKPSERGPTLREKPIHSIKVPEPPAKGEKQKKGWACCIVM